MADVQIKTALISVFNKEGLQPIISLLQEKGITIYSTGGTRTFIENAGGTCIPVESVTDFPSILGGRVKTLHPKVFGGILARRNEATDQQDSAQFDIPMIDLVIVDLYPFEQTVADGKSHQEIIEKIDVGGPSMLRAAAKNYEHVLVISDKSNYNDLAEILSQQNATTSLEERKFFAAKAFNVCTQYDIAISNYFNASKKEEADTDKKMLRYGENPHQEAIFHGNIDEIFEQLNGKEISYNNLVDIDAAVQLMQEMESVKRKYVSFAIIKHTNVCGMAQRNSVSLAFESALAGDPESAFGGIFICNHPIDAITAELMNGLFFEVLIAPAFEPNALELLKSKKNRILLQQKKEVSYNRMNKTILNGRLEQSADIGNYQEWKEVGGRLSTKEEIDDLIFANAICKHLKSNAIAIVKNKQLLGKGCGQTSRIDALEQALLKAQKSGVDLQHAVLASDAFFPFDDCVKRAHEAGIGAFIQPGGSIRDKDSISYAIAHDLVMVLTGMRHFKH